MNVRLVKRSKGQAPRSSGLSLDGRQVVVGDACMIPLGSWTALVGVMSLVSAEFPFGKGSLQARLFRLEGAPWEHLLLLRPEGAARTSGQLSHVYDRLAFLAGRVLGEDGPLLVGGGDAYVRYRDRGSPTGYDLEGDSGTGGGGSVALVPDEGSLVAIPKDRMKKMSLYEDFLVRLRTAPSPEEADGPRYLLCGPDLAGPLGRVVRSRDLDVAVSPVSAGGGERERELVLFRLATRGGRGPLPRHLTSYFEDLPGTALLEEAYLSGGDGGGAGRGVLVPAGTRPPVWLPNLAAELPESGLLVMMAGTRRNLDVRPFPQFVPLDRMARVDAPPKEADRAGPMEDGSGFPRVEIRLEPTGGAGRVSSAALLGAEEVGWLGQWIGRVPHTRFEGWLAAPTPRGLLVLTEHGSLDSLPFGRALRRHRVGDVLVPLGAGFVPEVPDEVLREKLHLDAGAVAVFLEGERLDVARGALRPLLGLAVEAMPLPRVEVRAEATAGAEGAARQVRVQFADRPPVEAPKAAGPPGFWRRVLGLFVHLRR